MTKIKHLLLFLCMAGCLAACKKDLADDNYDPTVQFKADTTSIRAFVKKNNIVTQKEESSGLFYQIIEPGTGDVKYTTSTQVTANYTGRLLDGTEFETAKDVKFTLNTVIVGWQLGIPLIQKGGKIRLIIPSFYGFGNVRNGPVPANSILDFTIELTDVQ
nr:FKBP-type peptidyl-prolyl cis-trans isomerase [Pedobacter panaciterrae]